MADELKKFGKYFLLDRVAQGGMAEIFRARMATADGGSRLLAIKRIIPSYSQNPEFVTMFKSEIKTTSGFTHPNIAQLYDYGEEDSTLYIAMEYVDGRNLRQIITRFAELKSMFPVDLAAYMLEQAANGMAYAHAYKDKFSGKSLNIVHRDISPQNLLISYDGAVKVIDFGIAKAVTNVESTRAGLIKGKPSYLSPEQISGEVLDGRSDIFALGIVLWELLTGRKLFAAENDFGVIKLIENCTSHVKPPSILNPKVPKELDAIVLKCLQKNRDHRYATAEELQRALHKFLYQFSPDFNPADLAYYVRDLFKNEIVEDRKRLLKLNEKAEQLLTMPVPPASKPGAPAASADDDTTTTMTAGRPANAPKDADRQGLNLAGRKLERSAGFNVVELKEKAEVTLEHTAGTGTGSRAAYRQSRQINTAGTQSGITGVRRAGTAGMPQKKPVWSPAAVILIVGVLGGGYWYYTENGFDSGSRTPAEAASATLVVQGNVRAATVMVNGKVMGNTLPATLAVPTAGPVELVVVSNGYRKHVQQVDLSTGETRSIRVELQPSDSAYDPSSISAGVPAGNEAGNKPTVQLRLNVTPPGLGTRITVNGSLFDISGMGSVPSDTPLEVVVEREGFRTFRKTLTIAPSDFGVGGDFAFDVPLEPAQFGYVSIKTTPSADAIISIDGVEERWPTPVSRKRLPVGTYRIKLVNSVLGMEKEVTVTVNQDRFASIEERLSVTDDSGRTPGSN